MREGFTVARRSLAYFPLFPITALWLLIDVGLRPSWDLRWVQWLWWIASIVFSLVMWQGTFAASRRVGGWLQVALVYGTALTASALVMLAVAFHHIFYTWPTAYAMVHMLREPREAWGYIRDGYKSANFIRLKIVGESDGAASLRFAGEWMKDLVRLASEANPRIVPDLYDVSARFGTGFQTNTWAGLMDDGFAGATR